MDNSEHASSRARILAMVRLAMARRGRESSRARGHDTDRGKAVRLGGEVRGEVRGEVLHPMLKPALRRAWRGRNTVQFGVTPAHAVTLGPVDIATGSFLELLDGTRGLPLLREEARTLDLSDRHVDVLVRRLAEAGLLDDPRAAGPQADVLRHHAEVMERQRPDVASLSVVHPGPGEGLRRMAARRAMRVQVRGAGRVGASIAAVLSGSGVGQVEVLDGGRAEPGTWRKPGFRRRPWGTAGHGGPLTRPPGRRRARAPVGGGGAGCGRRAARSFADHRRAPGRPLGVRAGPGHRGSLDRVGHASSLCGSHRGHRGGRPARASGRHRLRGVSGAAPRGPGFAVAPDAGAVALGAAGCGARLRSGAGHSGRRARRGPCPVLPGRGAAGQHRGALGGRAAPAGLAERADRPPCRLLVRGGRARRGGRGLRLRSGAGHNGRVTAAAGETPAAPAARQSGNWRGTCLIFPGRRLRVRPSWPRSRSASPAVPPGVWASGSAADPPSWSPARCSSARRTSCSRPWAS
ncbi:ThiF family protein [Streptomyces sp. KY70]|nr:ThiF family protein [Streptomyces sp. KY70]